MFLFFRERVLSKKSFYFILILCIFFGILPIFTEGFYTAKNPDFYQGFPISVYSVLLFLISSISELFYRNLFPFIVCFVTVEFYLEDVSSGHIKSIRSHTSIGKYLTGFFLTSFIVGSIIGGIPLLTNFIGLLMTVPRVELSIFYSMPALSYDDAFFSLYYGNPLLYVILKILMAMFFGGILSVWAAAGSLFLKNKFAVALSPLLLVNVVDMIARIFLPERHTMTSYFLVSGPPSIIYPLLSIFLGILAIILFKVKDSYYEES